MAANLMRGQISQYERALQRTKQLCEQLGQPARLGRMGERESLYASLPLVGQVTLAVFRDQLADAAQLLSAMPAQTERRGIVRTREGDANWLSLLVQVQRYRGNSHQLEPLLDEPVFSSPGRDWLSAFFKLQFALERNELDSAKAHYQVLRDTDFCPRLNGHALIVKTATLLPIANACASVGSIGDAALLYERLLPHAPYCVRDGAFISWGSAARVLGELAAQSGRPTVAECPSGRCASRS